MPLIRIELQAGARSREQVALLCDVVHEVMVAAFAVPDRDRYQIVQEHPAQHFIAQDTGLGIERTADLVLLQVFSRPRTDDQKVAFYAGLAEQLQARCGLDPADLIVSIAQNSDADWSFGHGRAQFLTGEL